MNYDGHNQKNEFLHSLASNSCIPLILQPARITSHYNNLIDPDIISGNLNSTISDHLPQFLVTPNMLGNILANKSNIYEQDWSKFLKLLLISCNMNYPRKNLIYLKQVYTFQSNQIKFENPKSSLPLKTFIVCFLTSLNPRKPKIR